MIPYYQRFLRCFPTREQTGQLTRTEEVLRLVGKVTGYTGVHGSCMLLQADHGTISTGSFPHRSAQVRELRGIGRYTAGARSCRCTGQRYPILEANTIRVLSRISAMTGDPADPGRARDLRTPVEVLPPRHGYHAAAYGGLTRESLASELGSRL